MRKLFGNKDKFLQENVEIDYFDLTKNLKYFDTKQSQVSWLSGSEPAKNLANDL